VILRAVVADIDVCVAWLDAIQAVLDFEWERIGP
jgi:hypothetical protein